MKANQSLPVELASGKRNAFRRGLSSGVTVLGLLIVGALIISSCSSAEAPAAPQSTATPVSTDPAPMSASPVLGPETAPVTIVEYSDFGCPTCRGWYKLDVLNQLRAKYGDQIRFVWRDFPVITLLSPKAAELVNSTFGNVACGAAAGSRLEIHPGDATRRGIEDGDVVRVFNDRGSCRLLASVDSTVSQGVVCAESVRWNKRSPDGHNVNVLTSERLTDLGGGPTFYSVLVQVERAGD